MMKKTYYDILGVDKQATLDEIKRAWRRKALDLHPDKNLSDSDRFRVLFQEAQQAYVVLSNPSERTRYDSLKHKLSQDSGDDVFLWSRTTLRLEDLSPYLHDTSEGKAFYTVYRELFERIELEEIDSARLDSESLFSDDCDPETLPLFQRTSFGSEDTEYVPSLEEFYRKFLNFMSIKSFSWRDKHCQAPQYRQYRRHVISSNTKARLAYRKEYSDLVRKIAENIMSRDPRYMKYFQERETKNEENRKLHEEREKRERYKRRDMLNEYKEAEWTKVDYSKICDSLADLSIEKDLEELYCPICEKRFKSMKSYENHEKGKKHVQELKRVKEYMRRDG